MADLSELGKTKKQKDTIISVSVPLKSEISSKGMAYTIDSVMQFKVPIRKNSNYNLSDPNVKKKIDSVWNTRNPK